MEKGKRLMAMLMILCLLISCLAGCGAGGDGQDAASADNSVAEDASEGYLASGEGETFVYGMGSSWDTLFPMGGLRRTMGRQPGGSCIPNWFMWTEMIISLILALFMERVLFQRMGCPSPSSAILT